MMKFKEYKDYSFVGELSRVSIDSFDQIFLKKQLEELEKGYFLNDNTTQMLDMNFRYLKGKILSNRDFLLCGEIRSWNVDSHDVVLAIFDLN